MSGVKELFPEITHTNPGNITTTAALEHAGFLAEEPPQPPASVPPQISPPRTVMRPELAGLSADAQGSAAQERRQPG